MKILKVRAWDKEENTFYYSHNDLALFFSSFGGMEMTEFTGMLDKNAIPIFEGDIVKRTYIEYGSEIIAPVIWREYNCSFEVRGNQLINDPTRYTLEIIGNIYKNQELLEQSKI